MKSGAGVIGAGTLAGWVGAGATIPALTQPLDESAMAAELAGSKADLTPDQALQKLVEGNNRFVAKKQQNPHQTLARLTEVAKGQHPFAAILGCADSRVPTEVIFDQGLGDIFVVRVAGNIATTEEIASHEFGTLVLGAKVLLVLGHARCGAVDAAIKGGEFPGLISSLVHAIKPAVDDSQGKPGDRLENAIKSNVMLQMRRLKVSSVISKLVQENKLKLVGGYYDLDTGKVNLIS
ncbi:carbonic anhydrase [Sivoneniella epilithica]